MKKERERLAQLLLPESTRNLNSVSMEVVSNLINIVMPQLSIRSSHNIEVNSVE